MSMCEYIYVMDFGEKIFEGTPLEVASSEAVRAAYLGSEAAAATPDEAEAANDRDGRNRPTAAAPTTS
jgi:ABC-type multidrug transport system ATPase subunit